MMNKQIAGLVLAVSVLGGVGAGALAHALTSDNPPTNRPAGRNELTLEPGAVGPIKAGMSKDQALATGYFVADVAGPAEGCLALPLAWKDAHAETFDVHTFDNGEIVSIGVRRPGVATRNGIGVGSTYDEVAAQYPDESLVEAGYIQSGIRSLDRENGGWIGFLFDAPPTEVTGSDPVTFVEVTRGVEPSLMRDGC